MNESILPFVLSHLPDEWEYVPVYKGFKTFTLSSYSPEYQRIELHFYGANVKRIHRVQNPFQYGRYMLRREMLQTTFEVS